MSGELYAGMTPAELNVRVAMAHPNVATMGSATRLQIRDLWSKKGWVEVEGEAPPEPRGATDDVPVEHFKPGERPDAPVPAPLSDEDVQTEIAEAAARPRARTKPGGEI